MRKKEGIEIGFEPAFNSGPENLYGHRFARAVHFDFRAMHLRDGRCGHRWSEIFVDRGKRFAKRGRNHRLRFALRKRRHLVLQAFQVACDLRSDHVLPCREKLAELDVGGSEPGQCRRQPAVTAFCARPLKEASERDCSLGRQRQRPRIDQRKYALARENEAGARKTEQMRDGSDHNRQPE